MDPHPRPCLSFLTPETLHMHLLNYHMNRLGQQHCKIAAASSDLCLYLWQKSSGTLRTLEASH